MKKLGKSVYFRSSSGSSSSSSTMNNKWDLYY